MITYKTMELQELKALYEAKEQIGLTEDQLRLISDDILRTYPKDMNFFIHIQPSDLDITLPDNDFVGAVPLRDCVMPIIIDEQMYVRIGIYKNNRRTYPTASSEFYLWLDILGVDNVVKDLPQQDDI